MDILTLEPDEESKTADSVHTEFDQYLTRTKNTICGRHPIGVLLGAMAGIQQNADNQVKPTLRWVQYAQSSPCKTVYDSSVSYASAYVVI